MEKQLYIDFAFVKQNADFGQVLGYYNLKAQRGGGKQLSVLCPFHDDTKPSLKVTPEKKGFHCFGCGAKGQHPRLRALHGGLRSAPGRGDLGHHLPH